MPIRAMLALLVVVSLLTPTALAQSRPAFKDGALVARKMERHYNGTGYKSRLAKSGGKLIGRVLCAHDEVLRLVECSGRLRAQGVAIKADWELEKRTARRAKLTWTFTGKGVFEYDSEIVASRAFGLRIF